MGFIPDVKRIVQQTPKSRQSLLFSATMSKGVSQLARNMLRDPIRVDVSPKQPTVKKIDQRVIMVENPDKLEVLQTLLHDESLSRAIVFTRTKHGANKVAKKLCAAGVSADAIHGNKSQSARQRALADFKKGRTWVLVATDIAARGLDIEGVSHVINFELPHEPEGYVHRIGRTGRAGASGVAWSLVDPSEVSRLRAIEQLIRLALSRFDKALNKLDLEDTRRRTTQAATNQADSRREGGSSRKRHDRRRRNQRHAA
jgi:ATP-dependent RNA helicase RhlE